MDTVASVPEDGEKIIEIQMERLRTFKNHPFKIRMDQEMIRLSASSDIYSSCLLQILSQGSIIRKLYLILSKSRNSGNCTLSGTFFTIWLPLLVLFYLDGH